MRTFKKYDLLLQATLILGFLIASLLNRDNTFIIGYCIVAGWQLISILIHFLHHWFDKKGSRRYYYQVLVLIAMLLVLIGTMLPSTLVLVLYLLLFTTPLMDCYYAWICYDEVYRKMQRPLYQLK